MGGIFEKDRYMGGIFEKNRYMGGIFEKAPAPVLFHYKREKNATQLNVCSVYTNFLCCFPQIFYKSVYLLDG